MKFLFIFILTLVSYFSFADDTNQYFMYRLQKGDEIGSVLHAMNIGPLWGAKGHVQKTYQLNKQLISDANELPDPGTWIRLPLPKDANWSLPQKFAQLVHFNNSKHLARKSKAPALGEKTKDFFMYRLQKGDEIGSVLHAMNIGPLWGAKGHVQKAYQLNKQLISDANELPDPGAWIRLPIPDDKNWLLPEKFKPLVRFKKIDESDSQSSTFVKVDTILNEKTTAGLKKRIAELEKKLLELQTNRQIAQFKKEEKVSPEVLIKAINELCVEKQTPENLIDVCKTLNAKKEMARIPAALTLMTSESFLSNWGVFSFRSGLFASALNSTLNNSSSGDALRTNTYANINLSWVKSLKNKFQVVADLGYANQSYNAPDTKALIDNESAHLFNTRAGLRYKWSSKLSTDLRLGASQAKLLKSSSAESLELTKGMNAFVQLSSRYEAFYYGPLSISFELGGQNNFLGESSDIDIDSGYGGYFSIDQRIAINKNHVLGGELIFEYSSIDTSVAQNEILSAGGRVFWLWSP